MDETEIPDHHAQLDLNLSPLNLGPVEHQLQDDPEGDTLREECGVFGILGHPEAAAITALGLHALQHRGQEAAGIVSSTTAGFTASDGSAWSATRSLAARVIERLPGSTAVGHVRYSNHRRHHPAQRAVRCSFAELNAGGFAVAHTAT